MKIIGKLPFNVKVIAKQYLLSLSIYFVFRVILFGTEIDRIDGSVNLIDVLQAFLLGLRFDLVISSYILILPFVLLSLNTIVEKDFKRIRKIVFAWCCIFYVASFLVSIIDIPFFNHFFVRLTYSSFDALGGGDAGWILTMISEEVRYWIFFGVFVLLSILYVIFSKKIIINSVNTPISISKKPIRIILNSLIFVIGFVLVFFGIRGRFAEKSPIRIGTAYFGNNNFLNQLGLNPNFTLLASFIEAQKNKTTIVNLIDDNEAIANMRTSLGIIEANDYLLHNILARPSNPTTDAFSNYNVVLIIMEGMSAEKMERYGNTKKLTPFLDSIANIEHQVQNNSKSYTFDNVYSTSIKTYGGVFSTLFSFPIIFGGNPMKIVPLLKFQGIASVLKDNNYSTIYFTTHDGQFDGIEGFLYQNDFEKVITQAHYPISQVKTTMGVPDDYMFRFATPILNDLHSKNKPFFATFLTGSDHLPYYIPDYFTPKHKETKYQATEYADYSLRTFLELSQKQAWYKNTIFVFVADHGTAIDVTYPIPLTQYHIPFIVYIPNHTCHTEVVSASSTFSNIGSQIDVAPTILGLLGINYINNTLGVNLFNENREFAVLDATTKYAVIDKDWFLIVDKDKASPKEYTSSLYKYKNRDLTNYSKTESEITTPMDLYAKSYFQTFDYILRNKSKLK